MSLNIGGSANDEFFRYTMPPIDVKIEGRGNGIKTVITNMADIAQALKRDPGYPTKYFAIELGALSKWDSERNVGIVNGEHQRDTLQRLLADFIKRYVLCASCGNPETTLKVKSDGKIRAKCLACGNSFDSDNTHKLATYIKNHPPESSSSKSNSKDGKTKKDKRKDKIAKENADTETGKDTTKEKDSSKEKDSTTKEKSKDKTKDKDSKKKKAKEEDGEIHFEVTDDMKNMKVDENASIADPVKQMEAALASADTVEGKLAAATKLQQEQNFSDEEILQYVFKAVVTDKIAAQVEQNAALLAQVTPKQRNGQYQLLALIEARCETFPENLKLISRALQVLYDKDILEEDVLLTWHEKGTSAVFALVDDNVAQGVRTAANAFVTWLQTADEESDDGDDEDDN